MLLLWFANPKMMHIENLQFSNHAPKIEEKVLLSFELNLKSKKKKIRQKYIVLFVK